MFFSVIGINFQKTPLETRQLFCFPSGEIADALLSFSVEIETKSVVILSTCNRIEIYSQINDCEKIIQWWAHYKGQNQQSLEKQIYFKTGQLAVQHLIHVCSGIDSMVIGESQILGQVKEAYQQSLTLHLVEKDLRACFDQAFSTSKRVKNLTKLSTYQVSVASIAVSKALEIDTQANYKYLVIGAGQTGELVLRYLHQRRQNNVVITNRTKQKGLDLARKYGVSFIPFEQIAHIVPLSDIIFTATSSKEPVLKESFFKEKLNPYEKWHIFDISVPMNTEKALFSHENVSITSIDDLQEISKQNNQHRQFQLRQAHLCIHNDLERFEKQLLQKSFDSKIKNYVEYCQEVKEELLEKALNKLKNNNNPEVVLREMAYKLTKKITHIPIESIKRSKQPMSTHPIDKET